jgi:hypothetical protein
MSFQRRTMTTRIAAPRTTIDILIVSLDEVLLAEPTYHLGAGRRKLWQCDDAHSGSALTSAVGQKRTAPIRRVGVCSSLESGR